MIINGSPRRHGTVENLLTKVAQGLGDRHDVTWVQAYDLDMRLCRACMKCRPEGECVFPEDDAHRVGRMIGETEALVVGTPTHWGNMSSGLKILFDRLVPTLMGERENGLPRPRHRGKPAIIVTACSTPWPFNFIAAESRGAFRAVGEVLHYSGFKVIAKVAAPGTKKRRTLSEGPARQALKAGRSLASFDLRKSESSGATAGACKAENAGRTASPNAHR